MASSELLTIGEAADMLRTPLATLRYWRHRGTGPRSFKVGRRVLYRHADLTEWIDEAQCSDAAYGTRGREPKRASLLPRNALARTAVPNRL